MVFATFGSTTRGVARIALNPLNQTKVFYAGHLRHLNKREGVRGRVENPKESVQQDPLPFE